MQHCIVTLYMFTSGAVYSALPSGSSTCTCMSMPCLTLRSSSFAHSESASKSRHVCVIPVTGRVCWYFVFHIYGIGVRSLLHMRVCRRESMQWSMCFIPKSGWCSRRPCSISSQRINLRKLFWKSRVKNNVANQFLGWYERTHQTMQLMEYWDDDRIVMAAIVERCGSVGQLCCFVDWKLCNRNYSHD